jgi:hypothetical protein
MPKKTTKNKQFRPDFGVFICPHVASGAAVLQVVRDAEGDWQFSCGDELADTDADLTLIAVGDVIARDASLAAAVELEIGEGIERVKTYKDWTAFELE